MSNTRRAHWEAAEVTAAEAIDAIEAAADEARAEATRRAITEHLAAELVREGHEPGVIAAMERAVMRLDDDYWLDIARTYL